MGPPASNEVPALGTPEIVLGSPAAGWPFSENGLARVLASCLLSVVAAVCRRLSLVASGSSFSKAWPWSRQRRRLGELAEWRRSDRCRGRVVLLGAGLAVREPSGPTLAVLFIHILATAASILVPVSRPGAVDLRIAWGGCVGLLLNLASHRRIHRLVPGGVPIELSIGGSSVTQPAHALAAAALWRTIGIWHLRLPHAHTEAVAAHHPCTAWQGRFGFLEYARHRRASFAAASGRGIRRGICVRGCGLRTFISACAIALRWLP